MVEIDMNKEPTDSMLTGIHLWEVKGCKSERSSKGDPMLTVTLRTFNQENEYELVDRIMLAGNGWALGKPKLIALGMEPTFKGDLDPLDFIGRKVWLATHVEEREALATRGANAGKMMTFRNMRVDVSQLTHKGYQPEALVPQGATVEDGPF